MSRYAAQARELCPESQEHHDRVWFCMTCKALESRLTPVSETLAGLLADASLSVTIPRPGGTHTNPTTSGAPRAAGAAETTQGQQP